MISYFKNVQAKEHALIVFFFFPLFHSKIHFGSLKKFGGCINKCEVLNVTCVLINYGEHKMKLMTNGFNMLKVDGSIDVPC